MPPIAVLIALADPTRCRIVEILRDGPQPVHVLAGSFDISRPAISRHLRVLKQARLISEKKSGRENRYALHVNELKPVAKWLAKLAPEPKAVAAAKPEPVVVPPAVEVAPAAKPVPRKVAAPKPAAKEAPVPAPAKPAISQMGFDF